MTVDGIKNFSHPEEAAERPSRRTHRIDPVDALGGGMRFGEVPVAEAEGAILAHSLKLGTTALKKGRVLSPADVEVIAASGLSAITVARLDPGDVGEDEAAERIAAAAVGSGISTATPFTGRANLHAEARGLLVFDRERVDRLNLVDEAITLGTLPPFAIVEPRQMVATVKIIPFGAPEQAVKDCVQAAISEGPLLCVAPFRPLSVGLVQTRLPGLKESILDKTRQVTEGRLAALGCRLVLEERCAHSSRDLAALIRDAVGGIDLLLIHGASAILDRRDVIPAAIVAAGGRIDHFGMPVDPGNLLLLGHVGERVMLGLPGCARSPKVNGFDWVLERIVAGLPVGSAEIMRMGSGGLLAEIPSRPLPRAEAKPETEQTKAKPAGPRIGALLLAAGQSRRMGGPNKLLAEVDGMPMVMHVARRLLASRARPIIAVLGNQADAVDAAFGRLPVERVRNPEFADGLSTSLKRGIAALPADLDGVLVCLGDMPLISGRHLDRLIAAFNPLEGRAIIVPTRRAKRGNPVLWSKRFFPEMAELAGDVGAKHLIGQHAELVAEVEMDDDAILVDIDTPEALDALRQKRKPTVEAAC
jgi:molybdenum cofactor cytidylyltransferase